LDSLLPRGKETEGLIGKKGEGRRSYGERPEIVLLATQRIRKADPFNNAPTTEKRGRGKCGGTTRGMSERTSRRRSIHRMIVD